MVIIYALDESQTNNAQGQGLDHGMEYSKGAT